MIPQTETGWKSSQNMRQLVQSQLETPTRFSAMNLDSSSMISSVLRHPLHPLHRHHPQSPA